MNNHMYGGMASGGGFLMFFMTLAFLALLFFLIRSAKFGGMRGFGRGPWGPGPWGGPWNQQQPGAEGKPGQPGQPAQGHGWVGPWGPQPRPEDDALKVLADRLASGDITPDEYLQRVSVLRQQG